MKNSNIATIAGKEFYRFFHDKGLIFSLVFPALLLYVIYSLVIPGFVSQSETTKQPATLYAVNIPRELEGQINELPCELVAGGDAELSAYREKLSENEDAVLLVFPADFSAQVAAYDAANGKAAPNVELYYKSVSASGNRLHTQILAILDSYESSMSNKFDVDRDGVGDLSSEKDVSGQIFSQLLPMLLLIFLFTGCMSFAPDSIAGEKERGTMATMLVTPIHRYEIVVGKILAFSVIAVLSGALTFVAVAASLPNLIGSAGNTSLNFTGYAAEDYGLLFLVILSTALLMISLVSLISACAKTTKEAASMVSPLMVVVMLIAFSTMAGNGAAATDKLLYCIPIYSSVQAMTGIFAYHYSAWNVALCVITNLVYSGLVVLGVAKLFSNERVMFGK